nr:ribosomal protein S19 [Cyanidiaceae sp.]
MTTLSRRKILLRYNIFYFPRNGSKSKNRNFLIVSSIKGINFLIYNGKNFINLTICDNIVGYLIGDFIITRKFCIHKKKS